MVNFKKIGLVLFASAVMMSFAACGESNSGSGTTSTPASSAASSTAGTSQTEESSTASAAESAAESKTESAEESKAESTAESTAEESAAESAAEGDIKDYVYFDNSQTKWENVYAYWWNSDYHLITNKLTGEPYPANNEDGTQELSTSWPGVQMEKIGDTDIYRCVMPVEATMIIFNSGVKDEEVAAGAEGYQTADMEFTDANAGQVYTIDTSVAAKPGRGIEKTKYKYNAGAWSDYVS